MVPVTTPETQTDLDDAIALLQTELNRLDRAAADDLDVGSAEDLQILRLLATFGPMRVGRIADVRSAGKATVSARVDRLERKDLLSRDRDPGDRRAVVVGLTPLGRSKAAASRTTRRDRLRPISDARHAETVTAIVAALRNDGS